MAKRQIYHFMSKIYGFVFQSLSLSNAQLFIELKVNILYFRLNFNANQT